VAPPHWRKTSSQAQGINPSSPDPGREDIGASDAGQLKGFSQLHLSRLHGTNIFASSLFLRFTRSSLKDARLGYLPYLSGSAAKPWNVLLASCACQGLILMIYSSEISMLALCFLVLVVNRYQVDFCTRLIPGLRATRSCHVACMPRTQEKALGILFFFLFLFYSLGI
jgi:hypothetical protein